MSAASTGVQTGHVASAHRADRPPSRVAGRLRGRPAFGGKAEICQPSLPGRSRILNRFRSSTGGVEIRLRLAGVKPNSDAIRIMISACCRLAMETYGDCAGQPCRRLQHRVELLDGFCGLGPHRCRETGRRWHRRTCCCSASAGACTRPASVIGRGDYHWQHEPCWYAVRSKGHWTGDRKQTTLWTIPSGGHDTETTHGTHH